MEILNLKFCEEAFWPELATFFEDVKSNPYFHPHEFDWDTALEILRYTGPDEYYAIVETVNNKRIILGYGFLRGFGVWEDVCLGVVIHPKYQHKGLGRLMCQHLHCVGKLRGLPRIRLHVAQNNQKALNLYESLGYLVHGQRIDGEFICYKKLI